MYAHSAIKLAAASTTEYTTCHSVIRASENDITIADEIVCCAGEAAPVNHAWSMPSVNVAPKSIVVSPTGIHSERRAVGRLITRTAISVPIDHSVYPEPTAICAQFIGPLRELATTPNSVISAVHSRGLYHHSFAYFFCSLSSALWTIVRASSRSRSDIAEATSSSVAPFIQRASASL